MSSSVSTPTDYGRSPYVPNPLQRYPPPRSGGSCIASSKLSGYHAAPSPRINVVSTTFVSSDNPIGDSGGRGGGGVVVLVRATSMKWPATKTSTGPDSRWVQKAVRRGEIINSGERGAYTSIWPLATSSCPFYMLTPDDSFYVFVIGAWNLLGENLRLARNIVPISVDRHNGCLRCCPRCASGFAC